MAREVSFLKNVKISKAQQNMLLAVLATAIFLGVTVSLVMYFVQKISFNSNVIAAEEQAIVSYTNAIKGIGICKKPAGEVYTLDEIKKCNPDSLDADDLPGTLRYNILESMAANDALNSVPKEGTSDDCLDPKTKKNYTYADMKKLYDDAETTEERVAASGLIKRCSALRIIPDALPAFKNEEALLASLNKIFVISEWEPESLSPTGTSAVSSLGTNLNTFSVRLSVEANTAVTKRVLSNIERSIREFNIERATIEWSSNDTLILQAQATTFYMTPSVLNETTKKIQPGGN